MYFLLNAKLIHPTTSMPDLEAICKNLANFLLACPEEPSTKFKLTESTRSTFWRA